MNAARALLIIVLLLSAPAAIAADRVRIAVMTLFHPNALVVETVSRQTLRAQADGRELVIDAGHSLRIVRSGQAVILRSGGTRIAARQVNITSRQGDAADFELAVPGKLHRHYRGQLTITAEQRELLAVIEMDLETAVASIVAAELPAGAPLEAMKAQAVASRSYLVSSGPRHAYADFCDTTHCQFLRRPPAATSAAARATRETTGVVLAWRGKPFAAMYSASCGGRTHSLREVGYAQRDYPYFAVACPYCRRSPERWSSTLAPNDAAVLRAYSERHRIMAARKLGWQAVPSNTFVAKSTEGALLLSGVGRGHGIGLCQRGASGLAREGKDFRAILGHYFPNATLESLAK